MGNNSNKDLQEQKFQTTHPNFKDAKLISEKGRRYIQARFKAQSTEFQDWRKIAGEGSNRPSPNYLLLPDKIAFKNDAGLCGNTGTVTNEYPYFPHLLSELINQRQPDRQLFKESELWYVLYSITAAKRDSKGYTNKLGDIKPSNIFVNDEGKIKVASIFSWPRELPSYTKLVDQGGLNFNGLLAPEDFPLLQNNNLDNDANVQSEIFAIGATVLSAGILDDLSSVYDYKNKTYNFALFQNKKQIWADSDRYSPIFKSIILNLVSTEAGERLTLDELWNFISPFEGDILEKRQFVIPSAPAKIERSFAALKSRQY